MTAPIATHPGPSLRWSGLHTTHPAMAAIALLLLLTATLALTACTAPEPTATREAPTTAPTATREAPTTAPPPTTGQTQTASPGEDITRTPPPEAAKQSAATRTIAAPKETTTPGKDSPIPRVTTSTRATAGPEPEDPLITALSGTELQCLELAGIPPEHLLHPHSNQAPAIACLSAANVDLLAARLVTLDNPALAPAAARCLSQQQLGDTAKTFPEPAAAHSLLTAAAGYALSRCLTQEQWATLGHGERQRQLYACMSSHGIATSDLLEALFSANQEAIRQVEHRAAECEPSMPEPHESPGGAPPQHPRFPAAADAARRHTGSPGAATLISVQEYTWSNGAMGCPQPGQAYTEALVQGYVIQVGLGPHTVRVHSNRRGTIMFVPVNCVGGPTP